MSLKDFFLENSQASMMRVLSLMAVVAAICLAAYGIYENRDLTGLTALCSAFLAAGFGGKILQKNIEGKKDQ